MVVYIKNKRVKKRKILKLIKQNHQVEDLDPQSE